MRAYLYAGVAVLLIVSHGWAFFSGRSGGKEDVRLEYERERAEAYQTAVEERDKIQAAADAAGIKYEREKAARAEEHNKLQKELRDAIAANSVYRECRLPADGLRLYRAAREAGAGEAAR